MSASGSNMADEKTARSRPFPVLRLRQRAGQHPMMLFSVIGACAFAGMMVAPAAGPAFASFNRPPEVIDGARTTVRTARLPGSIVDFACKGQNWGDENADCLRAIAEQSGRPGTANVRMIAAADPNDGALIFN